MTRVLYRGDSPEVLILALIKVIEYARSSLDDFSFGPLQLKELSRDGLTVEGEDLTGVTTILHNVPGLAIVEESTDNLK